MPGVLGILLGVGGARQFLSTTMTIGSSGGVKGASVAGGFGNLLAGSFTDGLGVSRSFLNWVWTDSSDELGLSLGADTDMPDIDKVFEYIVTNGTKHYRRDATRTPDLPASGGTTWTWTGVSVDPMGAGPTINVQVWGR